MPKKKRDARAAVVSSPLLAGIDALSKPDYHALNRRGERLLHAVLCAYVKHHMVDPEIGWDELSEILHDAICEAIGDDAFCEWVKRIDRPF